MVIYEKVRQEKFYVAKNVESNNSFRNKSSLWSKWFDWTWLGMETEYFIVEKTRNSM